jgi:hypothetical protein
MKHLISHEMEQTSCGAPEEIKIQILILKITDYFKNYQRCISELRYTNPFHLWPSSSSGYSPFPDINIRYASKKY